MNIRQEQPTDYDVVYQIIKEAFATAEYSDGNEQDLVVSLRKSKSFIPELSLVAIEDNRIVGHILFTTHGVKTPAPPIKSIRPGQLPLRNFCGRSTPPTSWRVMRRARSG